MRSVKKYYFECNNNNNITLNVVLPENCQARNIEINSMYVLYLQTRISSSSSLTAMKLVSEYFIKILCKYLMLFNVAFFKFWNAVLFLSLRVYLKRTFCWIYYSFWFFLWISLIHLLFHMIQQIFSYFIYLQILLKLAYLLFHILALILKIEKSPLRNNIIENSLKKPTSQRKYPLRRNL